MKCASPFIWRNGRMVTPGVVMSMPNAVIPACFGTRAVVAGEEKPPAGVVAAARPDLLAGHVPLVAVARRARREAGQVGAGVGLREELAPDLLAGGDLREPARALFGRAVREHGRTDEFGADEVRIEVGDRERSELLADDGHLRRRRREPAVFARPRRYGETGRRERGEEASPLGEIVAPGPEHAGPTVGRARTQPRGQFVAHLRPELVLGHLARW